MAPDNTDSTDETQQAPQGYCIEIHVGADGKISVDVEPEAEESAEEQGEGGEVGQPVSGFKEALQVAMDIYKNNGQIQDASAGNDEFNAGFASGPTPVSGPAKKFA